MKRRRFFQSLAALPAAPALLSQVPVARTAPAAGGSNIPTFNETPAEVVGEGEAKFFTPAQFAALKRLSDLLMPPIKGNPGAVDCQAPEFLDFLVGASPADRQKLYRAGLDGLNATATKKFKKAFAELSTADAESIVRPLLVPVPWTYDPPKDPMQHFLAEVHHDIRQATANSRQWAEAQEARNAAAGRRGFGGQGQYLKPIDPIYRS